MPLVLSLICITVCRLCVLLGYSVVFVFTCMCSLIKLFALYVLVYGSLHLGLGVAQWSARRTLNIL